MLILTCIVVVFLVHETYGFSSNEPTLKEKDGNVELEFSVSENYWHKNDSGHYFDCSMKHYKAVSDNIEWTKDGMPLNVFYPSLKFQYLGPRNNILVLPDSNKYSGSYTCTVVNSFMKTVERKFEVPPTKKPFIFVPNNKKDIVVDEGQNAKFKCIVSMNYTLSWRWLNYTKPIEKTERNRMNDYHFFKIRRVTKEDEGLYVCSVKNKFGTSEIYYNLKVKTKKKFLYKKPHLVKNYTSLPEIVMNKLEVACEVEGERPMNVSWFKDNVPIEKVVRQKGFSYTNENRTLVLLSLLPEDRGNYTCFFQNQYGSLKHTIEVEPIERALTAPYFIGKKKQEIPYYVYLGHDINVTVEVVVFNTAHFQLLLHYNTTQNKSNSNEQGTLRVLSTPRDIIYLRPENNRAGNDAFRYKLIFKFRNVSQEDFASYSIMAGNTFGYDVYQFQLMNKVNKETNEEIIGPPDQPTSGVRDMYIIILSLTAVIIIFVIFVVAFALWRRKSKRGFTNNNKFFWKDPNIELVHLNLEENNTSASYPPPRRYKHSSSRLSSCQTEKEYISNLLPPDPKWDVDFENIEFKGFIGEGAFGRVMLATIRGLPDEASSDQKIEQPVYAAVKMLKEDATEHELKDLLSEMQVMKSIGRHINIVNLLGASTQQGKLCVIIEYCRFGNLRNYLKERRPTLPPNPAPIEQLNLFHLTSFCLQVAKGMEYLASQKCVHRDIAARNILVSDNHIVKIADFGLARDVQLTDYYRKCTDGRLPVKWMAMEALFDRVYTVQSDIWSFGILAWEVLTLGGSPYPGIPLERLFDLLKQGYRMEKPVNCTDNMYLLMLKCWVEEPTKRPSFTEIIDDLENMISEVSGIDYLVLQPPITLNSTESASSNSQMSCEQTSISSANVFEEANEAHVGEKCAEEIEEKGERDRLIQSPRHKMGT